jgi:hypothetical protein
MKQPPWCRAGLVGVLSLIGCLEEEPDVETASVESALGGYADPVRIQVVLTANDDGSLPATVSTAALQRTIEEARVTLRLANIELTFDPASDITRINSTLLNLDCDPPPPGTNFNNPEDKHPAPGCNQVHDDERDRVAREWPGKLVVYFSSGDSYWFNRSTSMWQYGPRGSHWSNGFNEFVAMAGFDPPGDVLAHEIGHYLHLTHTMYKTPKTVAEAAADIRDYVESRGLPKSSGLGVFDNDGLSDTPPDPGDELFRSVGFSPCNIDEGELAIEVPFSDGSRDVYVLVPDRENIMSYWDKRCRHGTPTMSPMQVSLVRDAIESQNRFHLIAPKVLHSGIWEPGEANQTMAITWAFGDFAERMKQELEGGRHLVQMQAYNIGDNRFRWDGVWEPGDKGQSWVLGWAWDDINKQHVAELAAGRHLVHMQAYDLGGGQMRWDAVWEPNNTGQSWVMGWSRADFARVFNQQTAAGMHVVHMQAYDLGGGDYRWDATWEPGNRNSTRAITWAMKDIVPRFDQEIAAGKHCVHMQAYDVGGGNIRWDVVWEDGARDTSRVFGSAFNDFVVRLNKEADAGRTLVHMQAYEVGAGQVRYDGIWERQVKPPAQHRMLSETMYKFADRLNEEGRNGMRLVMMQAHTGR